MNYILPRNDTTTLSAPERTFLRSNALSSPALRLSGRSPSDPRPIRLSFCRSHNRSECISQFGQTRAAASIRAELIPPPNNDRPNDGQIKFNVEVGPMGCMGYDVVPASSNYSGVGDTADSSSSGGGGEQASYVQRLKSNRILRLLERTLLIGGSMDAEALCVQSGVWVWRLVVDVSLTDDGGNAVDACVLAVVAALRHYRLPEVDVGGGGGGGEDVTTPSSEVEMVYRETRIIHSDDKEPTPLPLHHTPLTATFALFADEAGTTSAVSAFLDPTDREELACNGILTWSYNKYGEMCCLDFPGGCELSPSQLMKSSVLGKKRCVEICEMLETALLEAEAKAQTERMERLKNLRSLTVVPFTDEDVGTDGDVFSEDVIMANNTAETDARAEDEEYRQLALDYASGHIAASVKEDKSSMSAGKNRQYETSSLFHALLHSAKSTPLDPTLDSASATVQVKESAIDEVVDSDMKTEEDKIREIEMRHIDVEAEQKNVSFSCSTNAGEDSDEEENIVQLQSEFSVMPSDKPAAKAIAEPVANESKAKTVAPEPKPVKQQAADVEEDQIDDLVMAVKKKKSKKSKKK
eukprot:CCRYP_000855-RB/>CCRYP_000855-RB protein AED:0.00 eAED:0.00 QI:161/1/1/1/0.33/0.25/4/1228/580